MICQEKVFQNEGIILMNFYFGSSLQFEKNIKSDQHDCSHCSPSLDSHGVFRGRGSDEG
jgi:hypothetical protein